MKGESIGSKNYIKEKLMLRSRRQKGAAFSFKWIHTAGLRDQAAQSLYHKLWYPGFSQQGRVLIWGLFWKERIVFMEHCRYLRRAGWKTESLISWSGLCWPLLINILTDSDNEMGLCSVHSSWSLLVSEQFTLSFPPALPPTLVWGIALVWGTALQVLKCRQSFPPLGRRCSASNATSKGSWAPCNIKRILWRKGEQRVIAVMCLLSHFKWCWSESWHAPPAGRLTGVNPSMNEGTKPYKAGVSPRISALIDLSAL